MPRPEVQIALVKVITWQIVLFVGGQILLLDHVVGGEVARVVEQTRRVVRGLVAQEVDKAVDRRRARLLDTLGFLAAGLWNVSAHDCGRGHRPLQIRRVVLVAL